MHPLFSNDTAWRIHERASSGLLVDARDYYLAFYDAAMAAERSILLLGWQFDSDVELVRGADRASRPRPDYTLLGVLDSLCRARPELEIRVLAWDHSFVFALEREVLQKRLFDGATCERFHFEFDASAPLRASHHQKIAVFDGRVAFVGSADLAHARWDTSLHVADDPLRAARGESCRPYHEVQAAVVGAPARSLVDLFVERWRHATGERLDAEALCRSSHSHEARPSFGVTVPMPASTVALSRTFPAGYGAGAVREIARLHERAIARAERLVYVETQYLTSSLVRDALLDRLRDRRMPRLDVVIVLPRRPEKLKETLTVGHTQNELLATLAEAADRHGHALGVYDVASSDADGRDVPVYVHAKLLAVDDAFLTVGSANLTNRSMALDSEIHLSYAAAETNDDGALVAAIRRARVRLLSEHLGVPDADALVASPDGLVARLDRCVREHAVRLRRHRTSPIEPGPLVRAVQELAGDYLDPDDELASALAEDDAPPLGDAAADAPASDGVSSASPAA